MRPLHTLLNLVFPSRCLGCQALGSFFCADCHGQVCALPEPFCPTCHLSVDPVHPSCRCGRPIPSYVVAAGEFTGALREAIHRFKYQGQSAGAPALAALLGPRLNTVVQPDHLLVPVALHPRRQRERGYNQAALLARALSRNGLGALDEHVLQRTKRTLPQVRLQHAERARNMADAFRAGPGCHGRTIVLIDDVCTTGATLHAAALALRAAGAQRIYAAVLAAALGRPIDQETA